MFQSKLSVFCKFCIYSKLATALLQNSLGSIRFPHSPSKYPKFLYHGLFILDFLNVGCCYTLMPGIPCKYLSRADLITFSLFAPFFQTKRCPIELVVNLVSNVKTTMKQFSNKCLSMFILHSMISQNHSEMPRDKIVDHNPVPIYLHCKESARVESQLWSNV